MAAAGFDNSMAIATGGETGPQSNMKRNVDRQRGRRLLRESRVHDDETRECRKEVCVGIDQHRDFAHACRVPGRELFRFDASGPYFFDRMSPFIDRLRERNGAANGEWLCQFRDKHFNTCAVDAQGHSGSKIASTTDQHYIILRHGSVALRRVGLPYCRPADSVPEAYG